MSNSRLIRRPAAAEYLNVSERTLCTLTKDGDIPSVKIRRSVRYDLRDLEDYIEKQKENK